MTGIRPAQNRFVNYLTYAEKDAPGIVTLNTHFKNHGYHTVSLGKVFHHPDDNDEGWSEKPWRPAGPAYKLAENLAKARENPGRRKVGPPFESADVPDNFYRDGKLADRAIQDLQRLAGLDQPFFLAVGFYQAASTVCFSDSILGSIPNRRRPPSGQLLRTERRSAGRHPQLGRTARLCRRAQTRPDGGRFRAA